MGNKTEKEYYIDSSGIVKFREKEKYDVSNIPKENNETIRINDKTYEKVEFNDTVYLLEQNTQPLKVVFEDEEFVTIIDEGYNYPKGKYTFYITKQKFLDLYFKYLGTEKEFSLIKKICPKCGKYKKERIK